MGWLAALGVRRTSNVSHDRALTRLQWQALITTTAYSSAVIIVSMVNIYHPSYQQENWHQSLLMIGVGLLGNFDEHLWRKEAPNP